MKANFECKNLYIKFSMYFLMYSYFWLNRTNIFCKTAQLDNYKHAATGVLI